MSMLTETTFTNKKDTLAIVEEVVEMAFEAVCATMGPNGQYAVINQMNLPKVTKDGVSVAKALDFNEARQNMIAKIITEPSIKTDNEVGDGTTTTVFMTYHLYKAFSKLMSFKNIRFLDGLMGKIQEAIAEQVIQADITDDRFRSMLLTSSNYESEIVDKILEIYREYKNPNIQLIKAPMLPRDEITFTKEIKFRGNFVMDEMVPAKGGAAFSAGAMPVLLVDGPIRELSNEQLTLITESSIDRPVLILARNFDPGVVTAIRTLSQNLNRVTVIPFKIEAAGSLGSQVFDDLGKLLGAVPLADISNLTVDHIVRNIPELALVRDGIMFDKEQEHVEQVAESILSKLDERYNALGVVERQTPIGQELNRRIGRLRANNVQLRVTGTVPSEATERYYRYEDVMKAADTALEFGIIPGIGFGYLKAREMLDALEKQSDEGLEQLVVLLKKVMVAQYEHLTDRVYSGPESVMFIDLVSGEESTTPMNVYDNAAATMVALKGAWSTAKTLGKISNVMGKSNTTYN